MIRRLIIAFRYWRDPDLAYTWLSAWRAAAWADGGPR